MFNKLNLKWLGGIFVVLLLIVCIIALHDSKGSINRNHSFKSKLVEIDSAKVTSLVIFPKSDKDQIVLSKDGKTWNVSENGNKFNADELSVKNMLGTLSSLTATRLASRNKSDWKEYEVTDSSATRVQVMTGRKIVADLYVGKFTYQQVQNANPYSRRPQGTLTSYLRVSGDDAVYALDGVLSMTFNRKASDFRNQMIIKSDKKIWDKLSFTIPGGSFSLVKHNEKWLVDGILADSTAVVKYLNAIEYIGNSNFIDHPVLDKTEPDYTLSIEGSNIQSPIKIKAFKTDTANRFAITSSTNEGSYFSGKQSDLFNKIFVDKNSFCIPVVTKK